MQFMNLRVCGSGMGRFAGEFTGRRADPTHLYETFIMESWTDYLRSRERTTAADVAIRERAFALHQGDALPRVTHQIYVREVG